MTKLEPKTSTNSRFWVLGLACSLTFIVIAELLGLVIPPYGTEWNETHAFMAIVSVVFGLAFSGLLYLFQRLRFQNAKWTRFSAYTVVIDMGLVFWLFLICIEWVHYWVRLWSL